MSVRTAALVVLVSTVVACSGLPAELGGGEGETGDSKPNQVEPEIEDPPQWRCAERVPSGEFVTTMDSDFSTKALETCVYAPPSLPTDPWTQKPFWLGLPDVIQPWLEDASPDLDAADARDMHPMFVVPDPEGAEFWIRQQSNEDDFRSGLIGNFALWPLGGVPDSGHRPPLVTASFADVNETDLVTMVGHPFYSGRYNAYGLPCNSTTLSGGAGLFSWSMHTLEFKESPHVECMAYVVWAEIDEVHPLYQHASGDPDDRGIEETLCLDNGRAYDPGEAALTSLERDGLIWLNWPETEFITQYLGVALQSLPFYEELLVFLDLLEFVGWELDYWKVKPDWPYSRWSSTGVCAHPARIDAVENGDQIVLRTWLGCPNEMVAVMPDFKLPDAFDLEKSWSVEGYCTFPHLLPPPSGMALTTPLDVVQVGAEGEGFSGARYVDLAKLTRDDLAAWSTAVSFEPTPDGYEVYATNELGRSLLIAFGVPEFSTLLAVDDTLVITPETSSVVPLLELGLQLDTNTTEGHFTVLVFDTPDNRRLHRYVVPTSLGIPSDQPIPESL